MAQQLVISRGSLFAGSRILLDLLGHEGLAVVWTHVATLMKWMGMEALYRRPNTSKPAQAASLCRQN